ncbi:MAG: ATP--guanido phosphotransferase [Phycisphaerae bacterium]|nr:protein arginine kinase [Phycisphaerae bacterium]NIP52395.1 protein arginine kinase [Phycisphaerae bacterium]NIS51391.1 protein arginine kinase [Phycisphaerae bacterium]NIU09006.1 protein arginine kinase [Phycisphaerae bacterium]NIU56666.1 ATP--guanido phosphotransferase [Phycisphaerae bacterium]
MKLTDLSSDINEWFSGSGPLADIVISSRIRLARNLEGYKFLNRCSTEEKSEILKMLRDVLMSLDLGDKIFYISVDKAPPLNRHFLMERHLISRHHAFGKGPRGVVIAQKEFFTAMINEEDHLRIQVLKGGLQLSKCAEQINNIDDMIEKKVSFAFSPRYGYLTACPTNLGTAIRVSVMLHLPALKITDQIEKFFNAAKDMSLAVRGLFGEGTEAAGDFYQISNQVTLGVSEADIIKQFENSIIPEIVEYENAARSQLLSEQIDLLDDKISRAVALLRNAHLISSQEALFLLSHLRLGLNMRESMGASSPAIDTLGTLSKQSGRKDKSDGLSIATINRLFMLTLPAHLQLNYGKTLDATHRDALRAQIIRSALDQGL